MASPVVVIAVVIFFLLYLYKFCVKKPKNFPPGPIRVPIFGSYLEMLMKDFAHPCNVVGMWKKKFNNSLIGAYIGSNPVVFLTDWQSITEMSNRKEFDARPFNSVVEARSWKKPIGIFFSNGKLWEQQRRFALRHTRDFGFGRRFEALESATEKEISLMLDLIKHGPVFDHEQELFDQSGNVSAPSIFYAGVINSYIQIMHGRTFARNEHDRLRAVANGALAFQTNTDTTGGIFGMLPFLRFICPQLIHYTKMKHGNDVMVEFIKELVVDHKKNLSDNTSGFFDVYLKELEIQDADWTSKLKQEYFTEQQLIMVGVDLLMPTATAVTSAMGYVLLELMFNPWADEKIYLEIKKLIGFHRLPTLDDRHKLPYLEACIRETLRRNVITPFGVARIAATSANFRGYDIPQGTVMIPSMTAANSDPNTWDEPQVFKPERFLDEFGYIKKKDISMPFGNGRRVCAGETFARQTMFLFLAGLLQHYRPVLPPEYTLNSPQDGTKHGLIHMVKDFHVKFVPRQWLLYQPSRYY